MYCQNILLDLYIYYPVNVAFLASKTRQKINQFCWASQTQKTLLIAPQRSTHPTGQHWFWLSRFRFLLLKHFILQLNFCVSVHCTYLQKCTYCLLGMWPVSLRMLRRGRALSSRGTWTRWRTLTRSASFSDIQRNSYIHLPSSNVTYIYWISRARMVS